MPTNRKRHSVTETDQVQAALERLRAADPNAVINFAELVTLGAELKAAELERRASDDRDRAQLRERFLSRTRTGDGLEWSALLDVHERGWVHSPDG